MDAILAIDNDHTETTENGNKEKKRLTEIANEVALAIGHPLEVEPIMKSGHGFSMLSRERFQVCGLLFFLPKLTNLVLQRTIAS